MFILATGAGLSVLAGDILIMAMVGAGVILIMAILITDTVGVTHIMVMVILTMDTDILTTDMDMAIIHTIPAEEVLPTLMVYIAATITITEVIPKTGLTLTEEQATLTSIEMVPPPVPVQHLEEVIHNHNTTPLHEQTALAVKTIALPDHPPQVTTPAEVIAEADHLAVAAECPVEVAAEDHLVEVVEEDNHLIFK